jgi:hypothetical protein
LIVSNTTISKDLLKNKKSLLLYLKDWMTNTQT